MPTLKLVGHYIVYDCSLKQLYQCVATQLRLNLQQVYVTNKTILKLRGVQVWSGNTMSLSMSGVSRISYKVSLKH